MKPGQKLRHRIGRALRRWADRIDPAPEDDDCLHCEACGGVADDETCVSMCDCIFCEACANKWQAEFDACTHDWEPSHDPATGEPGRYCRRCAGFVACDVEEAGG